jgi:hypothetical protein
VDAGKDLAHPAFDRQAQCHPRQFENGFHADAATILA